MNKIILAKVKEYKLECNGTSHYFTGKTIKNIKVGKCRCDK